MVGLEWYNPNFFASFSMATDWPLVVTKVDPFWQKPNIPLSEGLGAQVRNMSVSRNYSFQCGFYGLHVPAFLSLDHEINFSYTLTCTLTVHMSSALSNLTF